MDKINTASMAAVSQACINLNRVLNDMKIASNSLLLDDSINETLSQTEAGGELQRYSNFMDVFHRFFLVQTSTLDSYHGNMIAIIDKNGFVYSTLSEDLSNNTPVIFGLLADEGINKSDNYIKFGEKPHWLDIAGMQTQSDYILLLRSYNDINSGVKTGDLLIAIPEKELSRILEQLNTEPGAKSYLVSKSGLILSSTNQDEIGTPLGIPELKREKYIVNAHPVGIAEWNVVQVIPGNVLFSEITNMMNILICINIAFLIVSWGVSYLVARSISKPINRLNSASKGIAAGNFDTRVEVVGVDEVAELGNNFNYMAGKINGLIASNSENEKAKRELELQMLYAQINPHFLFNTLNSIRWMADASGVSNISRLTVALVKLLQNSIIKKNECITIREEIENVKNYIYIQRIRYMSFVDEYDVAEDILDFGTLKLILQPIVENSIIHGFSGIDYKGIVRISGRREGDRIRLVVSDNGVGMSKDQLELLLSGLSDRTDHFSGIGLSNVNERLTLHFGSDYRLIIKSERGVGTTTDIYLPLLDLRKESDDVQSAGRR